jgi:hypothetical protein
MKERLYKRLFPSAGEGGEFIYPCFDCHHNQTGQCEYESRTNRIVLMNESGEIPTFSTELEYRPCTYCRKNNPENYRKAIWFETIERPAYDAQNISREMKMVNKFYKNLYRLKAYPRYSANTSDITRDLNILEKTEGFVPKIIVVDYADILKPEQQGLTGVLKEDETWMALSRLAGERGALVVSGTQATGDALEARTVTQRHTARWKGKLGHVDMMLALSQGQEEKNMGIMRLSKMIHRHEPFDENQTITILQQISLGQFHLDSQL